MRTILSKQQLFSLAVSVLLSVFMVAVVAYGATITISNVGVGSGSSTPGAAVGVKGAGIFEGFVHAAYFRSTSTSELSGFGTSSPGAEFAVSGAGLYEGFVSADYFTSTSSNTSWLMGGFGLGTTTPGAKVGAKGAGLYEGFVSADYFTSTSSNTSWLMGGNFGLGTTTPGAKLDVRGGIIADGFVNASFFNATSTTATSTIKYSLNVATSSLQVDGITGKVAIGTTTLPRAQNIYGIVDPALTITGVGNTNNATGTLYIAGGGASGGQIILKSTDGNRCVSITVTNGTTLIDASAATTLTTQVVACPR